jgi:hypothetical protein
LANLDAARRAAQEFGAEIRTVKKTSAEYAAENDAPPCPSVMVDGTFIVRDGTAGYEQLAAALAGGGR